MRRQVFNNMHNPVSQEESLLLNEYNLLSRQSEALDSMRGYLDRATSHINTIRDRISQFDTEPTNESSIKFLHKLVNIIIYVAPLSQLAIMMKERLKYMLKELSENEFLRLDRQFLQPIREDAITILRELQHQLNNTANEYYLVQDKLHIVFQGISHLYTPIDMIMSPTVADDDSDYSA